MAQEEMDVDLGAANLLPEHPMFSRIALNPSLVFSNIPLQRRTNPSDEASSADTSASRFIPLYTPAQSHTSSALHMLQGALDQLRQAAEHRSSSQQLRSRRISTRSRQRGSSQRVGGMR